MTALIAFDQSLTASGITVLHVGASSMALLEARCVRTKPDKSSRHLYQADEDGERCDQIGDVVRELIAKYRPALAACEAPAGSQHANAAKALALAYATVRATLRASGLTPLMVQAFEAKRVAAGNKNATKEQVQAAMRVRFPGPWLPDGEGKRVAAPVIEAIADSLAVACVAFDAPVTAALRRAA